MPSFGSGGSNLVELAGSATGNRGNIIAADATLDEAGDHNLRTVSGLYGWDGTDLRRLEVSSPTYPLLKVSLWDDGEAVEVLATQADAISAGSNGLHTSSFLYGLAPDGSYDRLKTPANSDPGMGSLRVALSPQMLLQRDATSNDSDKTFTVPADTQWKVLWVYVDFTATASAGNRFIRVQFRGTSDEIIMAAHADAATAATVKNRYLFAGGLQEREIDINFQVAPLPIDGWLSAGQDIRVFDSQAVAASADDMEVSIMVEEIDA